MNPLVASDAGERIRVLHLCLEAGAERLQPRQFPYDSVVVLTHSGIISLDALRWLARHKVPVFVLDFRGNLQTSILHGQPVEERGRLRLRQYEAPEEKPRENHLGWAKSPVPIKPMPLTLAPSAMCSKSMFFLVAVRTSSGLGGRLRCPSGHD